MNVTGSKSLACNGCGKNMGVIRDASLRKGMVVYCAECNPDKPASFKQPRANSAYEPGMPDFLKDLFRGK